MKRFVLDTNLFFNMEPGLDLGKKTEEVILIVTKAQKNAREAKKDEFYMPPSIVAEFLGFFEDREQGFLKEFLTQITVKSPNINKVEFPASVFYKLIEDIRTRNYRGLTIAEEIVKRIAADMFSKSPKNKMELEISSGPALKSLRERYRQATRFGFLDSVADLDLIALSKELDATLVSADEGVVAWGRVFGVSEMEASTYGAYLRQFLR